MEIMMNLSYSELIRLNRYLNQNNISIRKLSEEIGVSSSLLNQFEKDKIDLSKTIQRQLNKVLEIDLSYFNSFEEIKFTFFKLIKDNFNDEMDFAYYQNQITKINPHYIKSSQYYSYYLAIKFILYILTNHYPDEFKEIYEALNKSIFSSNIEVYDYFHLYALMSENNSCEPKKHFHQVDISNKSIEYKAMHYYYLGMFLKNNGDILEALQHNHQALEYFKMVNNYKRRSYTLISIGNCYLYFEMEKMSIHCYEEAIRIIEKYQIPRPIDLIKQNIVWALLLDKNYDEANKILNEIQSNEFKDSDYYFYKAWIHHKKECSYKCKHYLDKIISKNEDEFLCRLAKILLLKLNYKAHKRYRMALENLYLKQFKNNHYGWLRFIAIELVEEYKQINDYQKVVFWLEKQKILKISDKN